MNIGFYGHSSCKDIDTPGNVSHIDKVRERFSANIVNIGVPQGSQERIIFELKKTTKIDIAIIFHSYPRILFLPKCSRDVSLHTVPSKKAELFWNIDNGNPISKEQFEKLHMTNGTIKDVFESAENYIEAMTKYKDFFWHPDLMKNRFEANLLLIDSYLYNNKIKSYHIINKLCLPKWATLQSGPVNIEIAEYPYYNGYNNMSDESNLKVATTLIKWIEA